MPDSDSVALVTGASRGIGRAVASELARTHRVIGTYRGNLAAAESFRDECGAEIFQMDVASPADRAAVMEFVRSEYGRLDLLVNNAGIAPRVRNDLLEASEESFEEVLSTNLQGPYFLTRDAAKLMLERGSGRIVFVTSISSYTASTNRGEYCVSKAGLSMAAQLYASRLAPEGIGVFEVRPGIIETDMVAPVLDKYKRLAEEGLLPQGRLGRPEDVALAVRAIADGNLDYSAGQVIDVDGGFHLRSL
ncbi:MAG: 3-ketoacyl-ACP reductase [Acidobacteriia bacterium]|nr:3-ketoacyl-ACP reductase [Terriglobia bacterium]MYG01023.1 3-ketoacyl-ACP reductase [Terriglobia bacterium]MYK12360.1 3-ketoacyl-ACP reductase [Terriglobia bacterium]